MELNIGTTLHGFTVRKVEDIPEVSGTAYEMLHDASGAKLLYIANDDANKAFSIAFKTPPANDTGVFHILEHSVLCGSKKFPVKEPFVNLLKSSMQTFLNAMTFPDKTMYPVASINERDLMNLMDVYMDAVLNPNIYVKETTFQQEGWHLEVAEGEDGAKMLEYNGVVFNEMKGALSNPESMLYRALLHTLFPNTAYSYESGGDPEFIPNLTYEEFIDNHRRHYRLDNSYIMLYGNMEPGKFLEFLDREYLTPNALINRDAGAPNPLGNQQPTISLGVKQEMVTSPESSCAAVGFVIGDSTDRIRGLATDILLEALTDSNEAPLKKAILEADLADSFEAIQIDSIQQPFAMLYLRKLKDEKSAEKLLPLVQQTMTGILMEGLDHERIKAYLARSEFEAREMDGGFGMPDGIEYAQQIMQGWLYDDEGATRYLKFNDAYKYLNEQLEQGYFESLARSIFLMNNHIAEVEIVPVQPEGESTEAKKLAELASSFAPEDFEKVEANVKILREAQERSDSPEELATIPQLSIDDIDDAPEIPQPTLTKRNGLPYLRQTIDTHGITYIRRHYDASCLEFDDFSYLSILAKALGKLDTRQHSAAEMDVLKMANLGDWNASVESFQQYQGTNILPKIIIEASALNENAEHAASITEELLFDTVFNSDDPVAREEIKTKLRRIVAQDRMTLKSIFTSHGNKIAASRLASYYDCESVLRDKYVGIEFYRFVDELNANFDDKADALLCKLDEIARKIFHSAPCTVSFAGSDEAFEAYANVSKSLDDRCDGCAEAILSIPDPQVKTEAFVIPADVCYAAYGNTSKTIGIDDNGSWLVADRALTFGYLWDEVRVKGGAYGVSFSARWRNTVFSSFRDPNLDETIERFAKAGKWLSKVQLTKEELEGYIISLSSAMDAPMKPHRRMKLLDEWFFSDYSQDNHLLRRSQVIETTVNRLNEMAECLCELEDNGYRCVVGGKGIIDSSNLEWKIDELLNS